MLQIKIDKVVAELETWFNKNDIIINAVKTGVMLFRNRQSRFLIKPFYFNNMIVDYIAEMKFLGTQIMNTLK
jgi:hypothetical protein